VLGNAQFLHKQKGFSHADSLRGSVTKERMWWDALHYNLSVKFNIPEKSVSGSNVISYKVLFPHQIMQIDLMEPLVIDSIVQNRKKLNFRKDGNAYFAELKEQQCIFEINKIEIYYHGIPQEAVFPPWDGGITWADDAENNPWVSASCQGVGPSIWFPNKDHQYDEPDSATVHYTVPETLDVVANGRHISTVDNHDGFVTHTWRIVNPINNYNIIPYIGKYSHSPHSYSGLNGPLDVDLYFLNYNMQLAEQHVLPDLLKTIEAFEYWFGPYPFYSDGFKMVEAPYLGMEHQSAIAYGNKFKKGYLGKDLSGTGVGLKWDYIVVHETGHEWFGNNITTKDIADMWVQEGFTQYSEVLYTEYWFGKEAADTYCQGIRSSIGNSTPLIGPYNVNREGSGDMYPKGANLLHTIRQVINNDSLFRSILIGLNRDFYHQVVRTEQVEQYISAHAGMDLQKIFDQYLRNTMIPQLEYKVVKETDGTFLAYRWTNCIDGFDMPLRVKVNGAWMHIAPSTDWQTSGSLPECQIDENDFADKNYYILTQLIVDKNQ
jgi:aminopeptidase N